MITELEIDVRNINEWRSLKQALPILFSQEIGDTMSDYVSRFGFRDPISGMVDPSDIQIDTTNYRETVIAEGITTRHRAVILSLQAALNLLSGRVQVYASEAVSPLSMRLRDHLEDFVGSEYLPAASDRASHPTVMHQDVLDFTFADESFDVYISCDVLEHVPDIKRAVNEAARILKPGGILLGTVPFAGGRTETIIRAEMSPDGIRHIDEPQYHGNPTRPDEGSLVFQIPAWDFLDLCRDAGFADPRMRLILSQRHGVFSKDTAFVITFYAVRE